MLKFMKYLSLLSNIHDLSGTELSGEELYSILLKHFSHPKALQIRKMLIKKKIIELKGIKEEDKRVKIYRISEFNFKELTKMFVAD